MHSSIQKPRVTIDMVVVAVATILALAAVAPVWSASRPVWSASRPVWSASRDVPEQVTFAEHVAPIFQAHCQTCHRPGDIGPMSLLTYQEARPWAKSIAKKVAQREMPPWHADPGSGRFQNDTSLSETELATVVRWVEQGAAPGDAAKLPPPRTFDDGHGWKLGEPALVFQYARPSNVGKEVDDEYRCYALPMPVDHDIWLKGVEYQPSNRSVVHHYIVVLDSRARAIDIDRRTSEPGFECGMGGNLGELGLMPMLGAWAPGSLARVAAAGSAKRVPRGSQIVLQVHYHNTTGADQTDHSRIAFHLAPGSEVIRHEPTVYLLSQWQLEIKAGDPAARHAAEWVAPKDLTLLGIAPHMHYRGKSMEVFLQKPNEAEQALLVVPRYDFNWQTTYIFDQPMKIPAGSKFRMASVHDNSTANPFNPDPTADVRWGEETHNEMSIAFLPLIWDDEVLDVRPEWPLRRIETPGDGSAAAATGGR